MRLFGTVTILAKMSRPWTAPNGEIKTLFSTNISQEKGTIIDTIRLTGEQFEVIEPGQDYVFIADYGMGKNGAYLRIIDITPAE